MKTTNGARSTIRFTAELIPPATVKKTGARLILNLPKNAAAQFPSPGKTMVEGTINSFPFRAAVDFDGKEGHLDLDEAILNAADAGSGDNVTVEITRVGDESEVRIPLELTKSLAAVPAAQAQWTDITPLARRDWILWISSARQEETRRNRIEKACDMLASGKRRVCCFGGLNWLTKDHPKCATWIPLGT